MASIGNKTLSTASQVVLTADSSRTEVRLFNLDSTQVIDIAPGDVAEANKGERIKAEDFTILTGIYAQMTISAIADGGTPILSYVTI